jgi:hypothetical protein
LVFQHEESAKKENAPQVDQESANNENDYLLLDETETIG